MRPSTTHHSPEVRQGTERLTNPADDSDPAGGNTTLAVRNATLVFARPGARNAACFRQPPRACDMPHRLSVDESNSGGRATSRSRAPLLTQALVQGSFLLLTYQCTSDLYYPLLFSCTSECSSERFCLFCCTSEFECTSTHNFPTFVLLPSRIKRRRPDFLDDCRKSVPEHRVSRLRAARAARGG